jgi:predicted mannosyl-3-phosphoglycerate phosphatase (HAD superfamily)
MADQTNQREELDARIAIVRANLDKLVEQATAFSGAGDEDRTAGRITEMESELAALTTRRDALTTGS